LSRLYPDLFLQSNQSALESALQQLGLRFEGVQHGALPDAKNLARVHATILKSLPVHEKAIQVAEDHQVRPTELSDFAMKLVALRPNLDL
jgi:inhibitor of KinA sporulation pathway (predicted exonuclease)